MVVTQWNDATELFLEYPHLVAGEATGNWAIHLSNLKNFKAVTAGTLTVRFLQDGREASSFTLGAPARAQIDRKDLSRIKKISGANLHRNWVMIPHVTNHDDADITELDDVQHTRLRPAVTDLTDDRDDRLSSQVQRAVFFGLGQSVPLNPRRSSPFPPARPAAATGHVGNSSRHREATRRASARAT
mgnify:CR=1 FL=1